MNYAELIEYINDSKISKKGRNERLQSFRFSNDPTKATVFADSLCNKVWPSKEDLTLAEEKYKLAIQLADKNGNNEILDIARSHLGNMYYKQKNFDKALIYLQSSPSVEDVLKCAEICKMSNNHDGVYSYYNVAEKKHCHDALLKAYEYARLQKDFDRMREYCSKYIKLDPSIASIKKKQNLANEIKTLFYLALRDSKNTDHERIKKLKQQESDFDQLLRNEGLTIIKEPLIGKLNDGQVVTQVSSSIIVVALLAIAKKMIKRDW